MMSVLPSQQEFNGQEHCIEFSYCKDFIALAKCTTEHVHDYLSVIQWEKSCKNASVLFLVGEKFAKS